MGFYIIRNDLSKVTADALVNPTHPDVDFMGGVEAQLFNRGGKQLEEARVNLGEIIEGQVVYTKAYKLNASYVFHTVGPKHYDEPEQAHTILKNCYDRSLKLAKELSLESIAFPLIATGRFKFPKDKALEIAIETIKAFLYENDLNVYLVVFDKASYALSKARFKSVQSYIQSSELVHLRNSDNVVFESLHMNKSVMGFIDDLDTSFSESVLAMITEQGKLDHEVYKKANIDRKLFSKIRSKPDYQPSKHTAIALGLALELNLDDFNELIAKAGYTLSPSSKTDLIIRYFIEKKIYDLFEINATLFEFTNKTL